MRIYMLSIAILLCACFACQEHPESALSSAANIVLQSSAGYSKASDKSLPTAENLIFESTDDGKTWQDISKGLPKDFAVNRVLADNEQIYLTNEKELYFSHIASGAPSWENEDVSGIKITDLFHGQNGPYISSYQNGFYQKVRGTSIMITLHNALKDKTIRTVMDTPDGAVFVGCESGLYKSVDAGKTWKLVLDETGVNCIVESEGVLVCGTFKGILRSTDGGEHWEMVLNDAGGAYKTRRIAGGFVAIANGSDSWGTVHKNGLLNRLYTSTDQGKTWQTIDNGLAIASFQMLEANAPEHQSVLDVQQAGKYLFCSTEAGVFRSADQGKTWEFMLPSSGKTPFQFAVIGQKIFVVKVFSGC